MSMFRHPVILAIVLALIPDTEQAALADVMTCETPVRTLMWDENPEGIRIEVLWSYDQETVCTSKQTCNLTEVTGNNTDMTEKEEDRMRIQLRPVELQTGNELWFRLEPITNHPFPKVYKVDENSFLNCDVMGWLPIISESQTAQPFEVLAQLLRPGNNYFIVENEGNIRCDMGLRLNVTVKTDLCQHDLPGPVCNGRGTCVTSKGQAAFSCHCCDNYKGSSCEVYDVCLGNPCYHGGECLGTTNKTADSNDDVNITDYTCKCPLGYYGDQCETKADNLCQSVHCLNNSTCTGNATHFQCLCPPGYVGNFCEMDYGDHCVDSPCRHGYCIDRMDGYDCQCFPGYHGPNCEFRHKHCMPNPCRNGGVGVNLTVSENFQWECHCHTMWRGRACTERAYPCEANPCSSHGVCVEGELDFFCQCKPGYTGHHCEININDCEPNPCHNGGICHDLINGYSCVCLNAHGGHDCEYTISIFNPIFDDVDANRLHEENRLLYIMAGALTVVLIFVAAALVVCYCRRNEDIRELCGIPIFFRRKHSTNDDLSVNVDVGNSIDCPLTSDSFFKEEPGYGPVTNPAFESQVV